MNQKPVQPNKNDHNQVNATSNPLPEAKKLNYSPAETQYHTDVLRLVKNARSERERPRKEFNDMGFSEADDHNIKLDLAYVPPAKDKHDIRVVSGLTREKTTTAVSMALSYDFDTTFTAFDKEDTIITELGETATDMVEKSNQLEYWRQNRSIAYRGMVGRGTYFTMEVQEFPNKNYKSRIPLAKIGKLDAEWTDKPRAGKVQFRTLEIDPKMVIVGDLKVKNLDKQPFMAIGRVLSEGEARSLFGAWDRWAYVPLRKGQLTFNAASGDADFFSYYRDNYAISDSTSEGEVEIVYFMRSLPYGNELAIYANGVSLTPIKDRGLDTVQNRYKVSGFPLTAISASGEYPLVDWQFERIPNFFYSKGNPAKTKFDQDVLDFWFRFILKKAVRSINPTIGNRSGQILSKADLASGNIISNIRPDDLFSILPAEMIQGVTSGEVSVMQMLKKEIEEKTSSAESDGQTVNQYQTATQFSANQKAQLLKLGALIDGIIRGEMRRADLRLRNSIIPYWMSKEGKQSTKQTIGETVVDIFDTFTVGKEGRDGKYNSTVKVGSFDTINSFDIMAQENIEEKRTGAKNKFTYLDPDKLDFVRTLFYIDVKPRDRDNNAMQQMALSQDVATAKNLFGPDSTNDESLKTKFAQIRKDSYDDWFSDPEQSTEQQLMAAMGGAGKPVGTATGAGEQPLQGGSNPANNAPPAQMAMQ